MSYKFTGNNVQEAIAQAAEDHASRPYLFLSGRAPTGLGVRAYKLPDVSWEAGIAKSYAVEGFTDTNTIVWRNLYQEVYEATELFNRITVQVTPDTLKYQTP